jgi:serine protease Do
MKRYFISAAAALLLTGYASLAQDSKTSSPDSNNNSEKNKNKLNEYDEIVIKRKNSDKDTKVTIEIKDDQILVDGKPIDNFENEDVSVRKRNINRYRLNSPGSPFRFEDGNWTMDGDDMLHDGNRAFLGVTSEGTSSGVKITSVSENSAAAKAGLKKDDIITKVNDKAVFDHEQLSKVISELKPDDKVTITYKRDGKENKATATLGKRNHPLIAGFPQPPIAPNAPVPPMVFNFEDGEFGDVLRYNNKPRLGLKVQDTEDGKGVKVLDVEEGSAADKAGIKEDDVITSFEGKEVTSAGDLAKASREAKDKSAMKVQLNRNGKPQTIEVKVPKKLRTANL